MYVDLSLELRWLLSVGERERESVFSSVVSRSWWMLFGVNISLALVFFLVMQSIVYEIRFDVVIYACDEKLKNN